MKAQQSLTRKKALKFMALGSVSGLFIPLFKKPESSASARYKQAGNYQSFDEIFHETYPFSLEPLPYSSDAFNPAIDTETMEIHHGRHHQGYVDNLNNALEDHSSLQEMTLSELIANLDNLPSEVREDVQNQGGGHLNHAIFWNTMSENGGEPTGQIAEAIERDFDSVDALKDEFSEAAEDVFGSGWAWLAADQNGNLQITKTENQDNPVKDGLTPLFGIDVWEHAYYLNYQNRRAEYIDAWWDLIYWDKVLEIYSLI